MFAFHQPRRFHAPTKPGTYATFLTSQGVIVCELFEKEAPETVKNFIGLAEGTKEWNNRFKKGPKLYDGTVFHRIIPNFMIQAGDPEGTGMGGPGYKFADETKGSTRDFKKPGILAMANAGPNTNGSQFFITTADTSWLTGKHTIFGEVVEGYDVAEKISKLSRDGSDRPKTAVTIESVTITPHLAVNVYRTSWTGCPMIGAVSSRLSWGFPSVAGLHSL